MANIVYMAKNKWTGLLDAIRTKGGTSALMTVDQATQAVNDIPTGGGGGITELVQEWTYDKLAVADLGYTIPEYTTTQQTVEASANLTPDFLLDSDNYYYYAVLTAIAYPIYNTDTDWKGRGEYNLITCIYEPIVAPANVFESHNGLKYDTIASSVKNYAQNAYVYYSGASAISMTSQLYGPNISSATPTMVYHSTTASKFRSKSPALRIGGSSTYFSQTSWDSMTDMRYQWKMRLYRVAKSESAVSMTAILNKNYLHIIDCANSSSRNLT